MNGQTNGKGIVYYDNGNKYLEQDHLNGQLHGKHIEYDRNGKKVLQKEYLNGKCIKW